MPHKDPEALRAYYRKYLKEYLTRPGKTEANRERCRRFYADRKDYNRVRIERMLARKRERKRVLVGMLGGKCVSCGYSEHLEALDFDHVDPSTKSRNIAAMLGACASIEKLAMEAAKCRLLCANCHRVVSTTKALPTLAEYGMEGC